MGMCILLKTGVQEYIFIVRNRIVSPFASIMHKHHTNLIAFFVINFKCSHLNLNTKLLFTSLNQDQNICNPCGIA